MPNVRNNAPSSRGLCAFAEGGNFVSFSIIDRIDIAPGQTAFVDARFLASEGAQALIASGDIEVIEPPKPAPVAAPAKTEAPKSKGRGGR